MLLYLYLRTLRTPLNVQLSLPTAACLPALRRFQEVCDAVLW